MSNVERAANAAQISWRKRREAEDKAAQEFSLDKMAKGTK